MKVFVTGATGFIGQHLIRRLSTDGFSVRCLVRNRERAKDFSHIDVELIEGDVTDHIVVNNGICGCDAVVHLANVYSMWLPEPNEFEKVNIEGTRTLFECSSIKGIKKIVYVSTAAVYGCPDERPFREESAPGRRMFSRYARSKAEGNRVAWEIAEVHKLALTVLYPGIVLGSGDDKASGQYIQDILFQRVPSTIFHSAVAVYVYVEDVIEAIIQALLRPEAAGKRYLLGKECLTGKLYAQLIGDLAQVRLPWFHFPDPIVLIASHLFTWIAELIKSPPWWGLSIDAGRTLSVGFCFDGSKAERELGISYTPIRLALEEAIKFYRERASSCASREANSSQNEQG